MAHVKKEQVREAILCSAYELFRAKGDSNCPMSEIARAAGTSVANLYVYFPSKLQLFYEMYAPIITSRLTKLASDAQNMGAREERLRYILQTLWRDIPKEDNAFARNLIQAVATTSMDVDKPHEPLKWNVEFIHGLILSCLPEQRRFLFQDSTVSFLVWMAFDGFAVNVGRGEDRDFDIMVEHFADMLLGKGAP